MYEYYSLALLEARGRRRKEMKTRRKVFGI